MVALGDLGSSYSDARAISEDGSVIVGNAGNQAFRWTSSGGMVGLGFLPGGTHSEADAVSANGTVIVGVANDANNKPAVFIWDSVHGMRNLLDVLSAEGVDPAGSGLYALDSVAGISADGTTIAGDGANAQGVPEGWIATIAAIPEPSTALMGALGLGLMSLRRRRCGGQERRD
jgi:uncharacterized membrane protein